MNRHFLILWALFLLHIFFMFYNLEKWAPFGWDQVDNAWAAMKIISIHKYPLLGMVAKQNSGIFIGPLYYYLVAIFYFFTHMDPIAAPILAGVTSVFSFWVIYFVSKRLFNASTALISLFIYTFSSFIIASERVQWPVNFIAPLSLLILYFLHRVITGQSKYLLHLAIAVGISFHIHFTAIFYPIIIFLSVPLIPRNKQTLKHGTLALIIGFLFFVPQIIYYVQNKQNHVLTSYAQTNYHGLHLRRVLQITSDAFIKFQSLLMTPYASVRYLSFLFVPLFMIVHKKKLSYLIALWFIVPWIVFATYKGEISDYYFSLQSYVAIMILAYLTHRLWLIKSTIVKVLIATFWIYWGIGNVQQFFHMATGNLPEARRMGLEASNTAKIIPFTEGDPTSYLYYYYMYHSHKWLPYNL